MSRFYLLTHNADWADEHCVPSLNCFNEDGYKEWLNTKIYPSASLGNGGDDWCDDLRGKKGKDLIKEGDVTKTIVDESFYKVFHKADLSSLSLGNIFEPQDEQEEDEQDEIN